MPLKPKKKKKPEIIPPPPAFSGKSKVCYCVLSLTLKMLLETELSILQKNLQPLETADRSAESLNNLLKILTPGDMEMVVYKARLLEIDSVESLRQCVDVLFENAINHECQKLFAILCTKLLWSSVHVCHETQKMVTFKEQVHQKAKNAIEIYLERQAMINSGQSKKCEKHGDNDSKTKSCFKKLRRPIALFSFIGHLYLLDFLPAVVVRQCVPALLDPAFCNEDTIEIACALLKLTGKKLEIENKIDLSEDIKQLAAKKTTVSMNPHTKFMIEEICAMRAVRWEPVNEIDFITLYNLFLGDVEEKLYELETWHTRYVNFGVSSLQ